MSDKSLSKADLAKCLVQNCKQYDTQTEALKAVNSVLGCIEMNLKDGKDIALIGFGKFEVKHRPERQGRNPSTGEAMTIRASNVVGFKAGKALKDAVNS